MPPKASKTTPTAGKAPSSTAGKAPVDKKEAGKKTAAPAGDKKKRAKTRKETYSSYIYKGSCSSQSRQLFMTLGSLHHFSLPGPILFILFSSFGPC